MSNLTIASLIANPSLASTNFEFYDWFAVDSSLSRRFNAILPKVKFLVKEGLVDGVANYLWCKNNAAFGGGTYDDVRFSTIEADVKDSKYLGGFCFQTWGCIEGGNAFIFFIDETITEGEKMVKLDFDNWSEMKKALKEDEELRTKIRSIFNAAYVEPVVEVKEEVKEVAVVKEKVVKAKSTKAKTKTAKAKVEEVVETEAEAIA